MLMQPFFFSRKVPYIEGASARRTRCVIIFAGASSPAA